MRLFAPARSRRWAARHFPMSASGVGSEVGFGIQRAIARVEVLHALYQTRLTRTRNRLKHFQQAFQEREQRLAESEKFLQELKRKLQELERPAEHPPRGPRRDAPPPDDEI
jgi:septal ring factor EnvC (AmiA/AmiB activator)